MLTIWQDNPVNMMLLSAYMKKNGWDYETASNGLEALQAFSNQPQGYDVIFMGEHCPTHYSFICH
jgi:CheY-like chemotaxis protein